jgi:ribonucleoside-diphosphate reductase alpha chain
MVEFSKTAIKILQERYLRKDEKGKVIEKPYEMLERVAHNIAQADLGYGYSEKEIKEFENKILEMMDNLEFLPNSPTLMNAGTSFQQLSACFVLPIEDNLDSIFTTIKNTALIFQTGGGTGFNFSNLRPENDLVQGIAAAAGPIGFMKIYDTTTEVIKQAGRRRGANMGILNDNHPDIIDFITAKIDPDFLSNFNISVGITDKFMEAAINGKEYDLINPRTKKVVETINANKLLNLISVMTWKTGDPGMIFLDTINRNNPLKDYGNIESTNPCGEVPLYPYEACNLGSINLSKLVKNGSIDYDQLKELIHNAIHFLDNVIDMSKFPIEAIKNMVYKTRKIGLGIMGFADCLFQLGIQYGSEECLNFIDELMSIFKREAFNASENIANIKGTYPLYNKSIYKGKRKLRNATILSIAPTGTISLLANCSSGIEPVFGLFYTREMLEGEIVTFLNETLKKKLKEIGRFNEEVIEKIKETGSLKETDIPQEIKKIFTTTMEIDPISQIDVQSRFQKYIDNSISKTINIPYNASAEQIREIYIKAWKSGCKGITVYRDKSRSKQVLRSGKKLHKKSGKIKKNLCPECNSENIYSDGKCFVCKNCGSSSCNV